MRTLKDELGILMDGLRQQRDELEVQLHLAKAEAGDEWRELEQKLGRLQTNLNALGDEANASAKDIASAARLLADELKHGYERLRRHL